MRELETKIAAWRARLTAAMPDRPDTRRELEDHLRDHFTALCRSGLGEDEALVASMARIGEPAALAREFARVEGPWWQASRPVVVMLGVMAVILSTMEALVVWRCGTGAMTLLFGVHVGLVAAGYLSVLTAGLIGAARSFRRGAGPWGCVNAGRFVRYCGCSPFWAACLCRSESDLA